MIPREVFEESLLHFFAPIRPYLEDPAVSDIMINGPDQIYVERGGKLDLTDITFRDHSHLLNICTRIVSWIGRRVDESSPMCDARLKDGSRVNIIIPPLAIDGAAISIRKFAEKKITLEKMVEFGSMSPQMMKLLQIAARCKLASSGARPSVTAFLWPLGMTRL